MSEILRTEKLKKYFGAVSAVDNIDLIIEEDLLTAIIGPNGAGKTTLINVLTGIIPADSGRIYFMGEDITDIPTHKRIIKGISRSFQITNIFPKLTVSENIKIPLISINKMGMNMLAHIDSMKDINKGVEEILEVTGLLEKREIVAGNLSHGDQRLLEIAIAIAAGPRLLFLDEPTAGMNPVEREKILENIKKLSNEKKITFVIVEHDMDVVFYLSERIIVMDKGRIIADGKPDEIRKDRNVIDVYLGEEIF